MECSQVRNALSAHLDQEAGVSDDSSGIKRHLASCAACERFASRLLMLNDRLDVALPTAPTDLHRIALERRNFAPYRPVARRLLGALAVIQLIVAVPMIVLGSGHESAHAARELASWDVAIAVGFLTAAIRPHRAWGMLPLVGAAVAGLLFTSGLDLFQQQTHLVDEALHGVHAFGLILLLRLAQPTGPQLPISFRTQAQ
jgi:predicted anti-sigma-YlaC factor YlaD